MSYWSTPELDDAINEEIWTSSVSLHRHVRAQHPSTAADVLQGRLGAGLPWVPDLVGRDWRQPGAVCVLGSAYSPFIQGYSGRSRSLALESYRRAAGPSGFLREFVDQVAVGDRDYYEPLATLLLGAGVPPRRVVLTDLVRACIVRTIDDAGGDKAIRADPEAFMAYALAGWGWTWTRLMESSGTAIVALGTVAEHGLLKLFARQGFRASVRGQPGLQFGSPDRSVLGYARHGCSLEYWRKNRTWWTVEGRAGGRDRQWSVLPVAHPAARPGADDPGYAITAGVLAEMLAGDAAGGVRGPTRPAREETLR